MKHLRLYDNFQNEKEISYICKEYNIRNWSINSEGLIDVDGDVYLAYKNLNKLPLKFGRVTGNFYCHGNQLTSLEGAPKEVGGNFFCDYNQLESLEGSPKEVGGHFRCDYNKLISLKDGTIKVGGDFICSYNKLISLEGSPKYVGGYFQCDHNKLVSFEGAPDFIGGVFICDYNPIYNIWILFKDYSKIELFNYYDIIRELEGKPAIVLSRLNQFLEDIGKPPVKNVTGYINL